MSDALDALRFLVMATGALVWGLLLMLATLGAISWLIEGVSHLSWNAYYTRKERLAARKRNHDR